MEPVDPPSIRPSVDSKNRVLWMDVPEFLAWFRKHAPHLTNAELQAMMERVYKRPVSRQSVMSLRKTIGALMTAETRARAYDVAHAHNGKPDQQVVRDPAGRSQSDIIVGLKQANRELLIRLEREKDYKQDLISAVYRAAKDAAESLEYAPVRAPKLSSKGVAETAIAVLSDWQLAKVTRSYNSKICEERIERYADKVVRLASLQRADHPVQDLRVYLMGDLVEGEMIFPGQAHRVDASLFRQVMMDGPRILGNFLRRMSGEFKAVHVVGVIGNHGHVGGRAFKEYHPETNADAMMYEACRLFLQRQPGLTWAANVVPGERHWYEVDRIGEKGYLLFHGDQVKGGFAGFPWYGFSKKILGWANGGIPECFDYAIAGHFHTPTRMLCGRVRLWVGGSPESDNTYAAEMLAAQGTPSQWLLFAHPKHGVTAEYEVHLG